MTTPPALTKEESASLVERLDKLILNRDTSTIVSIQDYQDEHLAYMNRAYGRFMRQFEMYFSTMVDYSHNINYLDKKTWPINRAFQFVIATNSLKQFYSAYTLLGSGSYEDAIAILRSVYESFLRIVFVSCHPECPYNAYKTPRQPSGTKFDATGFVRDELRLGWTTYSITSSFAHSNHYNVMGDMIDISTGKNPLIALKYEQDDDMISAIMNMMIFLWTIYLKAYDELFIVDISQHRQKDDLQPLLNKLHEYALISHKTLKGHTKNQYWRQTAVDIERIFDLMKTMDSDAALKWKDVWKGINK